MQDKLFQILVNYQIVILLLLLLLPIVVQGSVQRRIVAHWRSGQEE